MWCQLWILHLARISYVDPDKLADADLREALQQAMQRSTPRPEIQAVRASSPKCCALSFIRGTVSSKAALSTAISKSSAGYVFHRP